MSGEPVCDIDSSHKKPFECVIIGCYNGNGSTIPHDQVLVSVPCVLHSRKPPLNSKWRFLLREKKITLATCIIVSNLPKLLIRHFIAILRRKKVVKTGTFLKVWD